MRMAVLLLVIAVGAKAGEVDQEKLSPKQAWQDLQAQLQAARQKRDFAEYRRIQSEAPKAFLKRWQRSGQEVAGEELYVLGQIQAMASEPGAAMASFLGCLDGDALPDKLRTPARLAYANATRSALTAGKIDAQAGRDAVARIEKHMEMLDDQPRTTLHSVLGGCYDALGETDAAIEHSMTAARRSPAGSFGTARAVVARLLADAVDLDRLTDVRAKGTKLIGELSGLYEGHIASQEGKLEALKATPADKKGAMHDQQIVRLENQIRRMRRTLKRFETIGRPLELVGTPAKEWTSEHVFRGNKMLAEYKGKVVILDFWATWCPWCIRSFPALREVVKDYADRPLALVGVTATARAVWEHRYDLDDDLKHKMDAPGARTPPTLQLDRQATPDQLAAHRAAEKATIAKFMKNHAMNWDVVMIDKAEPAAKYALAGWPHAVVIDKQGRIRFLKSGALLKDRAAAVKKFRAVLDKLLAEK